VDHSKVVTWLFLNTRPVTYTWQFLGKVMVVQVTTGQFRPERAGLIHEQQPVTIDGGNSGESIRWLAFSPLLKPIAPA